jgi:hypothetical protein
MIEIAKRYSCRSARLVYSSSELKFTVMVRRQETFTAFSLVLLPSFRRLSSALNTYALESFHGSPQGKACYSGGFLYWKGRRAHI